MKECEHKIEIGCQHSENSNRKNVHLLKVKLCKADHHNYRAE